MPEIDRVPTAEEIMVKSLVTFRPGTTVGEAIRVLRTGQISGAPLIDAEGRLVGVLSELDCLRVLSSNEFYTGDQESRWDVLGLIDRMSTQRTDRKRYPDYREPEKPFIPTGMAAR